MNVRIIRPVVVPTAAGLRHFPPGLAVSIPDADAAFILRRHAGIDLSPPQKSRQKAAETPAEAPNAPA